MRLILLIFAGLLFTLPGRAQERVRNVRVQRVDSTKLEIRYDLVNTRPGDSVYFEVRSRLRGPLRILPAFVRGDIGTRITAGSDRRIIWNVLANGYPLDEEVQAKVFVKTNTVAGLANAPEPVYTSQPPTMAPNPVSVAPAAPAVTLQTPPKSDRNRKKTETVVLADSGRVTSAPPARVSPPAPMQPSVPPAQPPPVQYTQPDVAMGTDSAAPRRTRYAGPAWALLSVVAPGIGNIFVQTPKPRVGFRPLLTVACYGLIAYGLTERKKSQDTYAIYQEQKNLSAGEPYYQTANDQYHRYFLATRGALVLAATDVILTFFKGLRNTRQAQPVPGITLRPGIQAGQPTAVVRYSF